jgi:hypothetical protein
MFEKAEFLQWHLQLIRQRFLFRKKSSIFLIRGHLRRSFIKHVALDIRLDIPDLTTSYPVC